MKFCDKIIQNHLLAGGEVKRVNANPGYRSMRIGDDYQLDRDDLIADDWEIVVPEYDWDEIIKDEVLCVFWNNDSDNYAIGHLVKVLNNSCHKFVSETYADNKMRGIHWNYCKPFNPEDYKIAKNIKDYEK